MISEERIKEVLTPIFIRQDQASIHWPDIFEEVRAIEAEVAASLEAKIKHLEQERDALALQYKQMREALDSVATELGYDWLREEFDAAREALALTDLSTSIIQQHDNDVIERCAVLCEKSDRYRGDYFAEKIRALKQ